MSTDIDIELAMLIDMLRNREPRAEAGDYRQKLRLHAATLLSFLAGGVIGFLVYHFLGTVLLWATAALLLAIGLTGMFRARVQAKVQASILCAVLGSLGMTNVTFILAEQQKMGPEAQAAGLAVATKQIAGAIDTVQVI
jgi:VIT1/CCC1 family predicted Fe2+/Mn2+ transporter